MAQGNVVLRDRYELVAELGRGGMGVVWRAFDRTLKRYVAIKEVDLGANQKVAERTIREAQITAMINHPNIVNIHDLFNEKNTFYAVMELIDGLSLDRLIDAKSLDSRQIRHIFRDTSSALQVAHAQGVTHRDVKPHNIIVDGSGSAHLVDFGISRTAAHGKITEAGAVIGTLAYMAPEVAHEVEATSASDMWALGATIYCCFEGRAPFVSRNDQINLPALLNGDSPPPRNAGDLTELIVDLLDREPARRPTAGDVLARLDVAKPDSAGSGSPTPYVTVLDGPLSVRPSAPPLGTPRHKTSPRRRQLIAALVVVSVLAGGILAYLIRSSVGRWNSDADAAGLVASGQSSHAEPPGSLVSTRFRPLSAITADGGLIDDADPDMPERPGGDGQATCPENTSIAVAGVLSGQYVAIGVNIVNAASLAIEQHNRVNPGCQVRLKRFDTQGNGTAAAAVVPSIVDDTDVIGVVGPTFSSEILAAGPALNRSGLLAITPSSTEIPATQQGWANFFRGLSNDAVQGQAVANYLKGELGFRRICVIWDERAYGEMLARQVVATLGPTSDSECNGSVTPGQTDFSSVVARIASRKSDAVLFAGYHQEAGLLVAQLRTAGVSAAFAMGDAAIDQKFIDIAGHSADGVYAACACAPVPDGLEAELSARNGTPAGTFSVEAYDLTSIMLRAIDSGIADRQGMVAYIASYYGRGAARIYQWDSTGELASPSVWIYRVQ